MRNFPLWYCILLTSFASAAPISETTATPPSSTVQGGAQITILALPGVAQVTLLWTAIGLAVVTAFAQGLVTVLTNITEDANMWTFRFRIAKVEHWWWTGVSVLLSISLITITLSFMSGNYNEALGILALSTATLLTIVRYAVPAWRSRHFIEHRWLAWTGDSRTAIDFTKASMCGDAKHWQAVARKVNVGTIEHPVASDSWGPSFLPWSARELPYDPTQILNLISTEDIQYRAPEGQILNDLGLSVYDDGIHRNHQNPQAKVSLRWGEKQGFRRRVSRAISSMPLNLLASRPLTMDGYAGNGLCLAMGVLGRTKGLEPKTLVYDADDSLKVSRGILRTGPPTLSTFLEDNARWAPRPRKVMRSYYAKTMKKQYEKLETPFINAATELALIFADCASDALSVWLMKGLEQQSLTLNRDLRQPAISATAQELSACYRASYTSMIISINFMSEVERRSDVAKCIRPDLHCMALLLRAEGSAQPRWWRSGYATHRLRAESEGLKGNWKDPAAWLLGLRSFPSDHDFFQWVL